MTNDDLAFLDANGPFNPAEHAENASDGEFHPVPPGDYRVRIHSAEVKTTNKGDGKYINLRVDLEGNPAFNGRVVYDMITVLNPSRDATAIGLATFGQLAMACGFDTRPSTAELVGRVITVKLGIRSAREYSGKTYPAENKIAAYKPPTTNGAAPGQPAPADPHNDDDIPF